VSTVSLRGVVPSLVTPFDADGEIDVRGVERLVAFAIGAGADGVAVNALAGEARRLTRDERRAVAATSVAAAAGQTPVLVGVGAADRDEAVVLARDAEAEGAEAIVVPLPERLPSDAGAVDAVTVIASAVGIEAMVQDAPRFLGRALGIPGILAVLKRAPNVRSVKIEGTVGDVAAAVDAVDAGIGVWGGDGGRHLITCLECGAAGVMPGVEVVDVLVVAVRAWRAGDAEGAREAFDPIRPLLELEMGSLETYIANAKCLLAARGVIDLPRNRLGVALPPPEFDAILALAIRHIASLGALHPFTGDRSSAPDDRERKGSPWETSPTTGI
jgi:dihydrodipicolinate synthase/N-acetylneuraminate lyase